MHVEQAVARHYTHGRLGEAILAALGEMGKDPDRLEADDLAGADEFHLGWRAATDQLADDLGLVAGQRVLDLGSGIGGPARRFAARNGCDVTGIDLTDEFVQVANDLTRRCGLADRARFRQGSALDLPFEAASYDAVTLIHVGMNIADKARLFAQTRRVLKPSGRFGVYEVMRRGAGELPYPMPWAATPETSFVETPETYERLLGEAGFAVEATVDRRSSVLELARAMREHVAVHGAPPLGLHTLIGPAFKERMGNVMAALEAGLIAPVQVIAVAR